MSTGRACVSKVGGGRRLFQAGRRLAFIAAATVVFSLATRGPIQQALAASCLDSVITFVAHEDDDILFISPDLLYDVQSARDGTCVRTVLLSAGDAGLGEGYWSGREDGSRAAYAQMAGVADVWTEADAGIPEHPMPLYTLAGAPNVSLVFMRLPDGMVYGGGAPANGFESLEKLWDGTIGALHPVDGSASYTRASLIAALTTLMNAFQPSRIRTQDYLGTFGDGDNSDHHAAAFFTRAAHQQYATWHTFTGYMGYGIDSLPVDVFGADATAKHEAFFAYAPFDLYVCQTLIDCQADAYAAWLGRQYIVGSETGGGTSVNMARQATVTASSQNVATGQTADKAADGVVNGWPGDFAREWATTGGGAGSFLRLTWSAPVTLTRVVLHDRPNSDDQVIAGQLTFSDGTTLAVGTLPNSGSPLTLAFPARSTTSLLFTITAVGSTTTNIGLAEIETLGTSKPTEVNNAPAASATASSQNAATRQTADKAIDGVVDGWPGDFTKEWATIGRGTGSYLRLAWPTPVTLTRVVLHDRPNSSDQVTAGTLRFSDGTTLSVGTLPNDGSPLAITFPARATTSLRFTITAVSDTTLNSGLAEIEAWGP